MPLSPDELNQHKQRLLQRQAALLADIEAHTTRHSDGGAHIRTHRGETDDQAVVETLDAMEIAEVSRDTAELAEVRRALERLAAGGYGACCACGEEIAPARLQAAPEAALCVACQTQRERRG